MRSRWTAIGLGLLGGSLALAASTRPWATEAVPGLPAAGATHLSGADLVPAVPALGLAALACAVVLATAGRAVRLVAAVLLALAGAGLALAVAGELAAKGRDLTGWPVLALAGAALALLGGLLGAARGHAWPGPARRYERPDRHDDDAASDADAWTSLSQGHDPT